MGCLHYYLLRLARRSDHCAPITGTTAKQIGIFGKGVPVIQYHTAAESHRARHTVVNGRLVQVEYREYRQDNGYVMVRYSTNVDGNAFPLALEISKEVLQTIQTRFEGDIYHIIPDSMLERIREMTTSARQRIRNSMLPLR
jgi:hypothetical protein